MGFFRGKRRRLTCLQVVRQLREVIYEIKADHKSMGKDLKDGSNMFTELRLSLNELRRSV